MVLKQKYKHFSKNVFLNFLVFSGWDSEMSSILLLIHLMPPSPQGRNKRPGKLSARQAIDHLVKFIKVMLQFNGSLRRLTVLSVILNLKTIPLDGGKSQVVCKEDQASQVKSQL